MNHGFTVRVEGDWIEGCALGYVYYSDVKVKTNADEASEIRDTLIRDDFTPHKSGRRQLSKENLARPTNFGKDSY